MLKRNADKRSCNDRLEERIVNLLYRMRVDRDVVGSSLSISNVC